MNAAGTAPLCLPTNRRQRVPSLLEIAEAWWNRPEWPDYPGNIDMGEPFCAACGWRGPVTDGDLRAVWRFASKFIDRAHLVDHMFDGRDDTANLVPLCHLCHRRMPAFRIGQRDAALAWVRSQPHLPWWWQPFTDNLAAQHPELLARGGDASRTLLRHAWTSALEMVATAYQAAQPWPTVAGPADGPKERPDDR